MLSTQWVCRRCALAATRPLRRQFLRPASTAVAAATAVAATPSATTSKDGDTTLPAALLQRARNIAAEHAQLQNALATDFDPKSARRLGELSRVATALKDWESARSSLDELTGLLASPDKELRQLAADEFSSTHENLSSLTNALSASLTPRDPFADMPCLLEIRPGPGGQEGRYFADAVFKMYKAFCVRAGLHATVVKYETADGGEAQGGAGSESPLLEAVLEVADAGAYDTFRGEAGMHRVQRVPVTETKGRTHTSAVAVWVLPSFPENGSGEFSENDINDPNSDFYIDPKDVRAEKMRASGAGGQHVNKTESAIRLTHVPTGTVVSMQDNRSQHRNREDAWRLLRSRVAQQRREEREEAAWSLRNSVLGRDRITRGDKIRTYNYQQDRCTDHRSGLDTHNLPDVLAGGETLDRLMASAKDWLVARDIKVLVAEEEAKAAGGDEKDANGKKGKK
jgi:peptide chain release factor 1